MCKDVTCLRPLTQDSCVLPARTPSIGSYSLVTVVRTLDRAFSLDPHTFACLLGKDDEPNTEYKKVYRHFLNEFFWQEVDIVLVGMTTAPSHSD